jgi:tRNA 2-thiouridine synthesizing protein A
LPAPGLTVRKLATLRRQRLRSLRDMMAEAEGGATIQPDSTLDATGLLCPLPVLKARRALKAVPAGGILEVLATDPGATKDFEHFCQTTGCELIEASEQPEGILRFRLRKRA